MRNILYFLILQIFVSCTFTNETKKNEIEAISENEKKITDSIYVDTAQIFLYSIELKKWLNFYKNHSLKLNNFEFITQEELPNLSAKVDSINFKDDIYFPFYKFSNDRKKILDLISYNLILEKNSKNELIFYGHDVDSEVSILDLQNKIRKRILFVGPLNIIEDGFWINNEQFLIVGQNIENEENAYKPIIWFVDLEKKIIQKFEYNRIIVNMKCNYLEKIIYKDLKKGKS